MGLPNKREVLQKMLETIMVSDNVYFQPPESLKMKYPCIRYELSNPKQFYANNGLHVYKQKYIVTLIDKDPDSVYYEALLNGFPGITADRFYTANNLNHFVFTLIY